MKNPNRRLAAVLSLILPVALMPSCARDQTLTGMTVTPNNTTFEGVGAAVQMTALGTFEHPYATKDVTDKVQWSIDVQNLATVSSTGYVKAINICGSGNVVAKYLNPPGNPSGSVIVASAAISGAGQGTTTCNSATLSVSVMGNNTAMGSVTSAPAGITCPGTCSFAFALGATVVLTASGTGFGGWQGCDMNNPANTCTVDLTNGSRTVTVTLN
jgi:hypothetical protein